MTKQVVIHFCAIFIAALALCTSCSVVRVSSKGKIPVYFSDRSDHQQIVRLQGKKESYLWGLVAPDHNIFLDEVFYDQGLISVADIKFVQEQTTSDFWASVLSLGLYIPHHYEIQGRGRVK